MCQGDLRPGVPLQFIVNKGGGFNRVGEPASPCTCIRNQTVTPLLSSLAGRQALRHVYAGVARGVRLGRSAALSLSTTDDHCAFVLSPPQFLNGRSIGISVRFRWRKREAGCHMATQKASPVGNVEMKRSGSLQGQGSVRQLGSSGHKESQIPSRCCATVSS